jgi:hypothetical protein
MDLRTGRCCTWLSMQLKLSESFVSYCLRNVGDACNYTVRLLLVRPLLFCGVFFCWSVNKIWCFVTNITARLERAIVAFEGDIDTDHPDDESDDDDNEEDFMYEPDFELECDSDISNEELMNLKNEFMYGVNEDHWLDESKTMSRMTRSTTAAKERRSEGRRQSE